jgi:hypothetical protein
MISFLEYEERTVHATLWQWGKSCLLISASSTVPMAVLYMPSQHQHIQRRSASRTLGCQETVYDIDPVPPVEKAL